MLELEHNVMDFLLATDTPYSNDYQEPKAIIGMLRFDEILFCFCYNIVNCVFSGMLTNDVVAIDCKSPGYPCFKNPYAMDFNDSPVTCCMLQFDEIFLIYIFLNPLF